MDLKKLAIRGLGIIAVTVALCMFFSGTIKTITTAKVRTTRAKTGRLEEKTPLTGKLVFSEVEPVSFDLEQGQTLQITKVNARPGYAVAAGDVIIEACVPDYEATMKTYQESYNEAFDQLLTLESKNRNIRIRQSDEVYADAYFSLCSLQKKVVADRILMESLLAQEKLQLPDIGIPEGASEELTAAICAYREDVQAKDAAQATLNSVERYLPDDATWTYITSKHDLEEKIAGEERKMQALNMLGTSARTIAAPYDAYVAEVSVKAGDTYDGSSALFTINKEGTMPVLRMDISSIENAVREGMTVTMASDRYGVIETKVLETGLDSEGNRYADAAVTDKMIAAIGSVYAMSIADTPLTLVNRAEAQTTLLSVNAVHGTGDDRYVYTVETSYSSFGNSKMTVHKMNVTVLAEANGLVSIEEDLGYYEIAYMEDRPINDGDSVMLYLG